LLIQSDDYRAGQLWEINTRIVDARWGTDSFVIVLDLEPQSRPVKQVKLFFKFSGLNPTWGLKIKFTAGHVYIIQNYSEQIPIGIISVID